MSTRETNSPAYPTNAGPTYLETLRPKRKERPVLVWVLGGVVLLLVFAVAALGAKLVEDRTQPVTSSSAADEPMVPADPEVDIVDPELTAFVLSPKITEKQCFGSAGCNVSFRVDVSLNAPLDERATYEVTYEVTGVEDGPLVGTFEITGEQYTVAEESVSTARSSSKLKIRATSVTRVS